jgi:DNA-binding response OmpR family regulator
MSSIFLIENDDAVREVIRIALMAAGYSVLEATNGRQGINSFRRNPTDLVITDIYMPDRDGLEVIEALRRTHPTVKILAISGASGSMNYLRRAEALGADRILTKPFSMSTMLRIVSELLGNSDDPAIPETSDSSDPSRLDGSFNAD